MIDCDEDEDTLSVNTKEVLLSTVEETLELSKTKKQLWVPTEVLDFYDGKRTLNDE